MLSCFLDMARFHLSCILGTAGFLLSCFLDTAGFRLSKCTDHVLQSFFSHRCLWSFQDSLWCLVFWCGLCLCLWWQWGRQLVITAYLNILEISNTFVRFQPLLFLNTIIAIIIALFTSWETLPSFPSFGSSHPFVFVTMRSFRSSSPSPLCTLHHVSSARRSSCSVSFDSSVLGTNPQRFLFAGKYFILISKYFHGVENYWLSVFEDRCWLSSGHTCFCWVTASSTSVLIFTSFDF